MSLKLSQDDAGLPSYSDVITSRQPDSNNNMQASAQNQVHDELLNLAIRFNAIQCQKLNKLQHNDEKALNVLIPHVKSFLAEYSEAALPTATLIIIPEGTISPLAVPADDDLRSRDDFGRVIRVSPEKGGDGTSVWAGADMAERLASYLQPRVDYPSAKPSQSTSLPTEATQPKKSFWRKKPAPEIPAPPTGGKKADLPRVTMIVKAEEVAFRSESELGLYETQSVLGIVARVRVNAERQGR